VRAEAVPREQWDSMFRSQGTRDPLPRIRMLDGFNEGWITFEGSGARHMKGRVTLADVVRKLVAERLAPAP
jgi:NAD(P)H dehydrogenase (quinone)